MKIGIITYHAGNNVGAVLQAYALQKYCESKGHTVEFIDYKVKPGKRFLHTFLRLYCRFREFFSHSWKGATYTLQFRKLLKVSSETYGSYKELKENTPEYDLYITGSDQIWTLQNNVYFEKAFFLDFLPDKCIKISYAASMGQCEIPEKIIPQLANFLHSFSGISLREESALVPIKKAIGDDSRIAVVLDPTLIINKKYYTDIIKKSTLPNNRFIAAYLLRSISRDQLKILEKIKKTLNIPVIRLRNPESGIRINPREDIFVTPESFLTFFNQAEFTVCASYHAVVFSLIFQKSFIVIDSIDFLKNAGGNRRIHDLLSTLELEYRCISNFDERKIDQIINTPINWDNVHQKIDCKSELSRNWLNKYLY